MTTKTKGRVGRVLATALLAFMALVLLKPAKAAAFGPFGAMGAVLNAAAGTVAGNPDKPTEAELEAREARRSLAEAVFGLDENAGPTSLAKSLERRWERIRPDRG